MPERGWLASPKVRKRPANQDHPFGRMMEVRAARAKRIAR